MTTHDEYTNSRPWTPVDEYEEAPVRVIPCVSDHLVSWTPEDEYEERARARNYRRESVTRGED